MTTIMRRQHNLTFCFELVSYSSIFSGEFLGFGIYAPFYMIIVIYILLFFPFFFLFCFQWIRGFGLSTSGRYDSVRVGVEVTSSSLGAGAHRTLRITLGIIALLLPLLLSQYFLLLCS